MADPVSRAGRGFPEEYHRIGVAVEVVTRERKPTRGSGTATNLFASPEIEVATVDKGLHLSFRDGSLVNPESAVGMHPLDPMGPDDLRGRLDPLRDCLGHLDRV